MPRTYVCNGCDEPKPSSAYGKTGRGGRKRHCKKCTTAKYSSRRKPKYDWATMLLKGTKQSVAKTAWMFSPTLTAEVLRGLMQYQHYQCALTGRDFSLPSKGDCGPRLTYKSWLKKEEPYRQKSAPVLVRVLSEGHWEVGGVILVCQDVATAVEALGGVTRFTWTVAKLRKVTVPQAEVINRSIKEYHKSNG